MKCDCGFVFETRPGEFRNFDIVIGVGGIKILICPDCEKEWMQTKEKNNGSD